MAAVRLAGQASDTAAYISEPYLSLKVTTGGALPLGSSFTLMGLGGGAELAGSYRLLSFLYGTAGLAYSLLPVRSETGEVANLISLSLGPTLSFEVVKNLHLGASARGGFYYGFLSGADPSGSGSAFLQGGVFAAYRLLPHLSLGMDVSCRAFLGFSSDLTFGLGVSYHTFYSSPGILEINTPPLQVLPILYKFYDQNPISIIVLRNAIDRPITNIRVSFYTQEFMIDPKSCSQPFDLAPGEERQVGILALLTDRVLAVSEGTKVSATISAEYAFKGKGYRKDSIATLEVASRNAVVWDDDRKAACFVTAKDSGVLRFAKNFSALLRGRAVPAFDDALLEAMILHEALSVHGLAYARDPATPYAQLSRDRTAMDFLQFPSQTLAYRGGDCDDLSILYSALLESLGIETAFVTTPGHILAAFRLGGGESVMLSGFRNREDFIVRNDGVWVPVETTSLDGGFLRAWQLGVQAWKDAATAGSAGFFPVHEAWEVYEPVGYAGAEETVRLPDERAVLAGFERELGLLTKRETEAAISSLRERIAQDPGDPAPRNRLGVLYARYGMFDQALQAFTDILKRGAYRPALVNMGNVHFLARNYAQAKECYEKALEEAPESHQVLLALIKVEKELKNDARALMLYERLRTIDPELATQVVPSTSAAAATGRADLQDDDWRRVQWAEEESAGGER